jgi:hypothetical protein
MTPLDLLSYIAQERAALAHCYPLPSPVDCIRYALTELGEYEDAILRNERQSDKRNNGRERDWQAELGQCGEMIGCALIPFQRTGDIHLTRYPAQTRAAAVGNLAIALGIELADGSNYHTLFVTFDCWLGLCAYHQLDPLLLLARRYDQVRERHCQEVQP